MREKSHIHAVNWIKDLRNWGIRQGPNGQPLEELDYYDLRRLVMREKDKREDGE